MVPMDLHANQRGQIHHFWNKKSILLDLCNLSPNSSLSVKMFSHYYSTKKWQYLVEKEQNNSFNFLDVLVEEEGTGFLTSIYRKPKFTGQYIRWNFFSPKVRKISLIKTLVHMALMIWSKTKLGSELDKIKQLLIENEYPAYVLLSCISQKLANFAGEKTFGPEKCPVDLKLPWIGNVSSKFENQNRKAITSLYLCCEVPCGL